MSEDWKSDAEKKGYKRIILRRGGSIREYWLTKDSKPINTQTLHNIMFRQRFNLTPADKEGEGL